MWARVGEVTGRLLLSATLAYACPTLLHHIHTAHPPNLAHKGPLLPARAPRRPCRGLLLPPNAAMISGADVYIYMNV